MSAENEVNRAERAKRAQAARAARKNAAPQANRASDAKKASRQSAARPQRRAQQRSEQRQNAQVAPEVQRNENAQVEQPAASATAAVKQKNVSKTKAPRTSLLDTLGFNERMAVFLKSALPDFVMTLVMSVALAYAVSFAFESAAGYRGNIALLVAISAPLLLALYAGSWSKKALLPAAGATAVIAVVVMGVFISMTPSGTPMFVPMESWESAAGLNDVNENYAIFAFVAVLVPIVVYLLSRRRVGTVILLIDSMFACGWVQFLYRDFAFDNGGLIASFVVLVAGLMLFIFQTYRQSVYSAARAKRTSFIGVAAFSGLVSLICVLIGVGVFYGAINGFGLNTLDVKPFTRYAAAPIDPYSTNHSDTTTQGDDTTDNTNDEEEETSDNTDDGTQSGGALNAESLLASPVGQAVQAITGYDADDPNQDFESISFLIIAWTVILSVLLVVLLLVAAIVLQRYRRKRRLQRIYNESVAYRIAYLYEFMLGRFERMKIHKPEQTTPYEFAVGFEATLAPFTRGTDGVTFTDVTAAYMDACWGALDVSEEDYNSVEKYYLAFFKNAREYTGWPHWIFFRFWRI